MCFEVGRVNRDRLIVAGFGSQRHHDPREHPHVAPSLPAVVEGLVNTIFFRCITPPQAVAIYEYNSDQHAAIIDARHTMALGEIRPKPCHLIFAQPVKIASLNHNGQIAPSGLMGPGSRRGVCGVTVMAEMPRGGGQPGRGRRPAAHLHPVGPAAVESARTTIAIERLNEEFRRPIKTHRAVLRRNCSGRWWHRARPRCGKWMVGKPWVSPSHRSALTSRPDQTQIPIPRRTPPENFHQFRDTTAKSCIYGYH